MHRLALTALVLALSLAPVVALAVELPGELIEAPITVQQDHRAEWEDLLRERRASRIHGLREYAAAGAFPRKPGVPGWHHQFLDADGTPCAVASMIIHSGHAQLVRQTAQTHNDVVLSEVESGPLLEWVVSSGFTIEEIAIIQEPGFEAMIEPSFPEPIAVAPVDPAVQAEQAEQARIRRHLEATLALLDADTESSIAKAMTRLGDRVHGAPPPAAHTAMLR